MEKKNQKNKTKHGKSPAAAAYGDCGPLGDGDRYGRLSRSLMMQVDAATLLWWDTGAVLLQQALKREEKMKKKQCIYIWN